MRIAILGAGSYVSRAILPQLLRQSDWEALLYTRTPDQLAGWASERRLPGGRISVEASSEFGGRACDAIVNFVGAGDPRLVNRLGDAILPISAEWDERVVEALRKRPATRYIFASSGVATGDAFLSPRKPGAPLKRLARKDFYARAKAEAEERHRALGDLPIVDLRLYAFYSADMGTELGYLVCNILRMLRARSILWTDEHDIARDYMHPEDLSSAIMAVLRASPQNAAHDLVSAGPLRKFDLLRRFQERFGLQWQVGQSHAAANKMNYYSEDFSLSNLGFAPRFTAMEAVIEQATSFLASSGGLADLERG